MRPPRNQLRSVALLALAIACSLGGASACGDASLQAEAPGATASSRGSDALVLLARPRLIAAAELDRLDWQRVTGGVEVQPYDSGEDILVDLTAGREADVVEVCSNESAGALGAAGSAAAARHKPYRAVGPPVPGAQGSARRCR